MVERRRAPTFEAHMNFKSLIFLIPVIASCSQQAIVSKSILNTNAQEWTEECICGNTTFHYAYSFDDDDYAILSILLKDGALLHERAPHGPTPACNSRFNIDTLSYLKRHIPALLDDTYASFLKRNDRIAVHNIREFINVKGVSIHIVNNVTSAIMYSRIGFSKDKSQILINNGRVFLLYKKHNDNLIEIGRCLMWIS